MHLFDARAPHEVPRLPSRVLGCGLALVVAACTGDPTTTEGSATASATEATTSTSTAGSSTSATEGTGATTGTGVTTADSDASTGAETTAGETTGETTGGTTGVGDPRELWFATMRGVGVGLGDGSIHSVTIASDGDVLIAGLFHGAIEVAGETLSSAGSGDLFVARFAADGAPRWARSIGGPGSEHEATIVADVDGSALLSGEFSDVVELPGLPTLVSEDLTDALLVRLDAAGAPIWARSFGGPGIVLEPRAIVDPAGDLFLAVAYDGGLDLGGGPMWATGARDLAIARLDHDGAHLWSRSYGGAGDLSAHDLTVAPGGDLAITGWFAESLDLGGGPLTPGGAYVGVLDGDDGAHRWSTSFGDGGNTGGCGVRFAPDGGVLVSGWFQGELGLGQEPIVAVEHSDYFVARYDEVGALLWASGHGGPIVDSGCGIGRVGGEWILGGLFSRQIDLGGGPLGDGTQGCGFLAGLGDDGGHHWSSPVCASAGGSVQRLAIDPGGHVVFVGDFVGPMSLLGEPVVDASEVFSLVAHVPVALLGR